MRRKAVMATSIPSESVDRRSIALLALSVAAFYLLLHPYLGITHDARLYTLQALNHISPELYASDIFLRYGSQDDFTLFTPVYGTFIGWLGVEPAAALLTLLSQLAFLAGGLYLASTVLPIRTALAGLLLLLVMPDHYGAGRVFAFFEEFLTPRLLAEGLVLFSIATWLRNLRKTSCALLAVATLTHPIMAATGVALIIAFHFPSWRTLVPVSLLFAAAGYVAHLGNFVPSQLTMDETWLQIVLGRAEYLSLASWTADDWGRAVTVLTTLFIADRVLEGPPRRLARAALASSALLMLLSWIGGDLLRLAIVLQAQPWRTMWLATVIALLLLPSLMRRCWQDEGLARCAALLLAGAWLCVSANLALFLSPLAAIATAAAGTRIPRGRVRLLRMGCLLALALVILHALAIAVLAGKSDVYRLTTSPALDLARTLNSGAALPVLLVLLGGWAASRASRKVAALIATLLVISISVSVWPTTRTWLDVRYDKELVASFETWRAIIPPGSEVLWATGTSFGADAATVSWLVLERPSFMSRIQATTGLFSREAALEMQRRTQPMLGVVPAIGSLFPQGINPVEPRTPSLSATCAVTSAGFVVTLMRYPDAVAIEAPAATRNPYRQLKLYQCP